jgi:hypothetical protein
MDVVADHALAGGAARLLGGAGQALLAKDVLGLLEVPGALDQRALAIHHAGARLLTELAHHLCCYVRHMFSVSS